MSLTCPTVNAANDLNTCRHNAIRRQRPRADHVAPLQEVAPDVAQCTGSRRNAPASFIAVPFEPLPGQAPFGVAVARCWDRRSVCDRLRPSRAGSSGKVQSADAGVGAAARGRSRFALAIFSKPPAVEAATIAGSLIRTSRETEAPSVQPRPFQVPRARRSLRSRLPAPSSCPLGVVFLGGVA
jgi:hypothetical protein